MILPWCLDYSRKLKKNTFLDLLIQEEKYDLPYTNIVSFDIYFLKTDIWCYIKITESINSIISIIVAMLRQRKICRKTIYIIILSTS